MRHDITAELDNCIDALRRGKTQEESLALYPDDASELAPLLATAVRLRTAPKIQASESAMRASKNVFLAEAARLREQKQRPPAKPWQRLSLVAGTTFAWPRPRALVWTPALSAVIALLFIFCSGTTAIAASRSLPDEPLYGIKLAAEQVQLALTSDPIARADLTLSLAEKRVDEVASLTAAGRSVDAPAIQRLAAGSKEALTTLSRVDEPDMRPLLYRYLNFVSAERAALSNVSPAPADAGTLAAALVTAHENEELAKTAVTDPGVLKEDPKPTSRAPVAVVKETPTPQPTPDARRMRTPAASATAASQPAQPAASPTHAKQPALSPTSTAVAPSPTPPPAASSTATTVSLVQFSGAIERIGTAAWTIGGKSVVVNGDTTIDGAVPRVGARADVVAVAGAGQALQARSIHVQPLIEIPPSVSTVYGIVLGIGPASWNIAGQTVMVDANTLISGVPAAGSIAEARGSRKGDLFLATSIIVKGPAPELQVQGRIDSISASMWTIGGQNVAIVPGFTVISGTACTGATASASVVRQDGGGVIAKLIVVSSSGAGSPTVAPSPTVASSATVAPSPTMPTSPISTPAPSPTQTAVAVTPSPVQSQTPNAPPTTTATATNSAAPINGPSPTAALPKSFHR